MTKVGYKTDNQAAAIAKQRGLFGVTGRGQQCKPVPMTDGSWGFLTWDLKLVLPNRLSTRDYTVNNGLYKLDEIERSGITYTGYGANTHAPSGN